MRQGEVQRLLAGEFGETKKKALPYLMLRRQRKANEGIARLDVRSTALQPRLNLNCPAILAQRVPQKHQHLWNRLHLSAPKVNSATALSLPIENLTNAMKLLRKRGKTRKHPGGYPEGNVAVCNILVLQWKDELFGQC
mmetsp:Transcript_3331/g.7813  ORF Transcript_3331/g.7813 Transcript_3331/m.7813 type:complete len:138 (-) Transcript_3331:185-598(-)